MSGFGRGHREISNADNLCREATADDDSEVRHAN